MWELINVKWKFEFSKGVHLELPCLIVKLCKKLTLISFIHKIMECTPGRDNVCLERGIKCMICILQIIYVGVIMFRLMICIMSFSSLKEYLKFMNTDSDVSRSKLARCTVWMMKFPEEMLTLHFISCKFIVIVSKMLI